MWFYLIVFIASLLVDLIPLIGPPAWIVMVFFQVQFKLNIWLVLVAGVMGSTLGRYLLSQYMPWLSNRYFKNQKNEELKFIGKQLSTKGWQIQLFAFLYTLMPLPSTPLFTTAGMIRIKAIQILPAFFAGKFISDMIMVISGDYLAQNADEILQGLFTWKSILSIILVIVMVAFPLFIDWMELLENKKFKFNFRIWK